MIRAEGDRVPLRGSSGAVEAVGSRFSIVVGCLARLLLFIHLGALLPPSMAIAPGSFPVPLGRSWTVAVLPARRARIKEVALRLLRASEVGILLAPFKLVRCFAYS